MIALAIAIGAVLGWWKEFAAIAGYIKGIAMTIGLIVLCWYSYYDARMRNRTWFIVWVVAVIIVIVFQILGFAMPTLW
jgi:nitrate reductase gamma subunit